MLGTVTYFIIAQKKIVELKVVKVVELTVHWSVRRIEPRQKWYRSSGRTNIWRACSCVAHLYTHACPAELRCALAGRSIGLYRSCACVGATGTQIDR